jgi:hypothetical protein
MTKVFSDGLEMSQTMAEWITRVGTSPMITVWEVIPAPMVLQPILPPASPPKPDRFLLPQRRFKVYIKQQALEVDEFETWQHVSERLSEQFGMQKRSLFKLEPVEGLATSLNHPGDDEDDEDGAYSFDWLPDNQDWWVNVHDEETDRRRGQGMQITLRCEGNFGKYSMFPCGRESDYGNFEMIFATGEWKLRDITAHRQYSHSW